MNRNGAKEETTRSAKGTGVEVSCAFCASCGFFFCTTAIHSQLADPTHSETNYGQSLTERLLFRYRFASTNSWRFTMDATQAKFLVSELTALWESEFPATCKVLEAVPDGLGDYKPDPKSRTAWELATHLATSDI